MPLVSALALTPQMTRPTPKWKRPLFKKENCWLESKDFGFIFTQLPTDAKYEEYY